MATFQRFTRFLEGLCKGEHNLSSHTVKAYLSNATPDHTSHVTKSEVAEISAGFGYTAGGVTLTVTTSALLSSASLSSSTDPSWTASGGSIGPFRYVVLYNDSHASDALIGYWDRGSALTLADGETFTLDIGGIFSLS